MKQKQKTCEEKIIKSISSLCFNEVDHNDEV